MEPIKKKTTVDLAVEKLIQYIQNDDVIIGSKLPSEITLCRELNISRTTVREAYRVLESRGYIDIRPDKGAFVRSKEQNFLQGAINWIEKHKIQTRDYLEVRMVLDPLVAKLAAKNASESDLDELRAIHADFIESVKKHDNEAMANLDAQFHQRIVLMTKNDLLEVMVRITNSFFKILRKTSFQFEEHANHAIELHERILTGIAEGDSEKAEQASLDHMRLAFKDLCED